MPKGKNSKTKSTFLYDAPPSELSKQDIKDEVFETFCEGGLPINPNLDKTLFCKHVCMRLKQVDKRYYELTEDK